ncbi:hypothetical protein C2G38_2221924 [Gigaspora rosea]|uniref:Uncharacterized protein n=1 Tax=Gigaspora rosea TaxID=44941 RepID=A0A397U2W3_9GLOM|nr:hypothetical protein C2G38_2221924 [Gigaspora rosea]
MFKRNASKFYKKIAEEMIWTSSGFDERKQIMTQVTDTKQIVYDTILKYISQEHELDLFVLNTKYDPTNKPVSVQDFFNSKHVEKSQGNKMVMDFIVKRNEEDKEDLEPGQFKDTNEIDKLYYFKNLKDICTSFFACSAKAVAEKIELFYKEQIDMFKQTTISFPIVT